METEMTGRELQALMATPEFQRDLEEMSSCLASIMQERPIVYLLAKRLCKQRQYEFELEKKHNNKKEKSDLVVGQTHIEFKFNYDRANRKLEVELKKHSDNLKEILPSTWGVLGKILKDVTKKKPDIFVWIVCSRDLRNVADDDIDRICLGRAQRKYNLTHTSNSEGELPPIFDCCLSRLNAARPFSLVKHNVKTNGWFPSTYHFRICEFTS
jgi:hypothetical protein